MEEKDLNNSEGEKNNQLDITDSNENNENISNEEINTEKSNDLSELNSIKSEEKKEESSNIEAKNLKEKLSLLKDNATVKKLIIIIFALLVLIIGIRFIYNKFVKNDDISGVKKVLSAKYTELSCINSNCDGFIAVDGDKLSKYKVYLYNSKGSKVATYKVNYNRDEKTTELPIEIGDDYYISTTVKTPGISILKYSIKNKRGKSIFETENKLSIINENLISMKEKNENKTIYNILNKKGKTIYSNIQDMEIYLKGKYISVKLNDTYYILNSKGEKILTNYEISRIVTDNEDKELYAIIKNTVDKVYNYYSFDKDEIVGDSFTNYTDSSKDYDFLITKKENGKVIKYKLFQDGKQEKIKNIDLAVSNIKSKIDTKMYSLYSYSVYDENQKNVLVGNNSEKSIGILNIDSKEYKALYNYKSNKTYYSTVTSLNSDNEDNKILKISCSLSSCDKKKSIIYDIKNNKEIYKIEDINISDYKQYEDGYKVIKFETDKNNKYGSKNVVFDKNNKELEVSNNDITIMDKKIVYGKETSYYTSLYSVKKNKLLSNEKTKKIEINDNVVYKYTDNNYNTIILNKNGDEVIKVSENDYITLNKDHYIYIKNNLLYIYNIEKDKTYKYKLKDNEKLNDASGNVIDPYKNAIFINNSSDKYVKIINFKGNQIDKIKNLEISSVEVKDSNDKAFIIVKKNTKEGSLYGLYVAE